MARTCAALRANILCFIQPVADATGSKYAGLRPEMDQPIKVSGRNDFTPVVSKVSTRRLIGSHLPLVGISARQLFQLLAQISDGQNALLAPVLRRLMSPEPHR